MDEMAALNEFLIALKGVLGTLIDCSICVEDLKRNKCIGYILPKLMSEALISIDVVIYIFSTYLVSTKDMFHLKKFLKCLGIKSCEDIHCI